MLVKCVTHVTFIMYVTYVTLGGGFLEKATKRTEEQKALAKVVGAGNGPPHKLQQTRDPLDLHFLLVLKEKNVLKDQ